MPFPDQVERWRELIRRHAPADLRGDPAFERIALAVLQAESGGRPDAPGDYENGRPHSIGLYQLHDGGMGSGLSVSQRSDPDVNAGRAVPALAAAYRASKGDPVRTYIRAINPGATPDGPQVSRVMTAYAQGGGGGGKPLYDVQAQAGGTVADPRTDRMRTRIADLQAQRDKKAAEVAALQEPSGDEVPAKDTDRLNPVWKAKANAARQNREIRLRQASSDLSQITTQLNSLETDLANDPNAKPGPSDPTTYRPVTDPNTGKVVKLQDPVTGQIIDLPDPDKPKDPAKPDITIIGGKPYTVDRATSQDANGNVRSQVVLTPVVGAEDAAKSPDRVTAGRRIVERQPDGTWRTVYEAPQEAPQRAPQTPAEAEHDVLQNQLTSLQIQKAQQGLTPGTLLAIQNHLALVDQLEKMMRDDPNRMPPDLANRYIAASQANMEAAFRGTTVFDEQKEAASAQRERQRIGADLLNTRLQAGSSLASSLTSSAFGSGVMMPAGKSSLGYAPAALAMSLTSDLQGGPEVSDFGRSLLMGAGVGPAPTPAPAGPVGPVVGRTASGVPVYDPSAGGDTGGGYLPPPRPSMPR